MIIINVSHMKNYTQIVQNTILLIDNPSKQTPISESGFNFFLFLRNEIIRIETQN